MQAELDKLQDQLDAARRIAYSDALTGMPNRHGYDRYVAALQTLARTPEFRAALEGGKLGGLLVAQVDIDHFKSVNTMLTHFGGDAVLKEFSGRLTQGARVRASLETGAASGRSLASLMVEEYLVRSDMSGSDLISRWGGEEFFCLFPLCYRDQAAAAAAYDDADAIIQRMMDRIRRQPIMVPVDDAVYETIKHQVIGNPSQYYQHAKLINNKGKFLALPISASIGYAVINWEEFIAYTSEDAAHLFRNVVDLMRRAKKTGRNRAITVRSTLHDNRAAIHVLEGRSLTQNDLSEMVAGSMKVR